MATETLTAEQALTKQQETQTWWRVRTAYGDSLSKHEVEKVTEKTLWWREVGYLGRVRVTKALKDSVDEHWFDNEADAVEYTRSRFAGRVVAAYVALARAEAALAAFNEAHPLPATEEHDGNPD